VFFVPDLLVSIEIKFLDIGKPCSYSLKATGDQPCISVQEGNKVQPPRNNTTALLGSEHYGLFTFCSLAPDQLVPVFFSTQHLTIKRAIETNKKQKNKKTKGLVDF